ncbi:MAG: hypothetical protein IK109_04695 [Clostridiales bacterium]|nr:hypothetical protein [Clostridiales bacterium]
MWTCPKCHFEMEDGFAICENCGANIDELLTEQAEPEKMPAIPTTPSPRRSTPRPASASTPKPASASTPKAASASTPKAASASTPKAASASTPKPRSTPKPQPRSSEGATPAPRKGSTPRAISKTTDASSKTGGRATPRPIRRGNAPGSSAPEAESTESKGLGSGDLSSMDNTEKLGGFGYSSSGGSSLNSLGSGDSNFKDNSTFEMYNEGASDTVPSILGGAGSFEQPGTGSFKPLPPFVSAFEADRPSPFAPAKKTASSETPEKETPTPAPRPQSQSERDSHTLRMDKGEIATSTKACPVCGLRALISEKYCRNCNYQFSNNSVFSRFEEKHINILAILAAIAMAASVFVSFITYTIENASTLAEEVQHVALINKVDGYAFLLLAALALVFGCFGRNKLVVTVGILSVIATVIEDYFLFYDITQVKKGGHIDNELGFYLLAAGAALILISGIYGIVQEKKKQEHLAEQFNMSSMYR